MNLNLEKLTLRAGFVVQGHIFLTITSLEEVNKSTEQSARGPYEPAKCFHPVDCIC